LRFPRKNTTSVNEPDNCLLGWGHKEEGKLKASNESRVWGGTENRSQVEPKNQQKHRKRIFTRVTGRAVTHQISKRGEKVGRNRRENQSKTLEQLFGRWLRKVDKRGSYTLGGLLGKVRVISAK